jgi:hypothetical protein
VGPERGTASGWRVDPSADEAGKWRWYAFGPKGALTGTAESERDAETAAQAALEELTSPATRSSE